MSDRVDIGPLQPGLFPYNNTALLDAEISTPLMRILTPCWQRCRTFQTVSLNSPRGSVLPALQVANKVHALGLSTRIDRSQACASAYKGGGQRT